MTIIQYEDKRLKRIAIESSLRHDEEIACENATVIVDKDGNVTAWFNNDVPVRMIVED